MRQKALGGGRSLFLKNNSVTHWTESVVELVKQLKGAVTMIAHAAHCHTFSKHFGFVVARNWCSRSTSSIFTVFQDKKVKIW